MRTAFTATEGSFEAVEYALVCGVAGEGHYLTFQRYAEDSTEEDWGIHLEFDDQSNGDYGCIAVCRIGNGFLSVDLVRQLGKLVDISGFNVELRITEEEAKAVRSYLRLLFRDKPKMLVEID